MSHSYITLLIIFKEVHMATNQKDGAESRSVDKKDRDLKNGTLPPCDKPHVAEASRNQDSDEACDDGVR
jgi:hypothetical protein